MLRWEDYMETSLLEDKFKAAGTAIGKGGTGNELGEVSGTGTTPGAATASTGGSQGLFDAIRRQRKLYYWWI